MEKEIIDSVLKPHYPVIIKSISDGIDKFRRDAQACIPKCQRSALSSLINNYVRNELLNLADLSIGFAALTTPQQGFFLTYSDYAFRPKKVSSSLRSSNIKTERVESILTQDYSLPGLENNMGFLTLGYQISDFYGLCGVFIIMEAPEGNEWHIRIDNFAAYAEQEMNLTSEMIVSDQPRVRVKIKTENGTQKHKEA